jgi:hypothetical protein
MTISKKFLLIVGLILSCSTFSLAQNNSESASNLTKTAKPVIKPDPAAYDLLKAAHDARQVWPADFAGFTAEVVFNDNGKTIIGKLSYEQKGGVALTVDEISPESKTWLVNQLNSLLSHRRGGDFAKRDGANPITFGDDDKSPIGRLVILNDALKSSYRVRDSKVVDVTRTIAGERFTISVLETTPVENGKYLPRHFTVTYFDAKTGTLKRSESFSDAHSKVDGVWFPTQRRVIRADNGVITARVIEIRNPQIKTTPN